jgi:endonuclease-3 related protein
MPPAYSPGRYGPVREAAIFEICAGAILTQNTAWSNVEKALGGLFSAGIDSPARLAGCPLGRLARLIRPSGYYKQKSARLKEFFSRSIREHPEGLGKWFAAAPAKDLRAELLSYKGVGPETADCMALYGGGKLSFVIDAYTRRAGERLGLEGGAGYAAWQELFERNLPPDVKMYNEYHALLVRLGKDFCKKTKPLCGSCPLRRVCEKGRSWKSKT